MVPTFTHIGALRTALGKELATNSFIPPQIRTLDSWLEQQPPDAGAELLRGARRLDRDGAGPGLPGAAHRILAGGQRGLVAALLSRRAVHAQGLPRRRGDFRARSSVRNAAQGPRQEALFAAGTPSPALGAAAREGSLAAFRLLALAARGLRAEVIFMVRSLFLCADRQADERDDHRRELRPPSHRTYGPVRSSYREVQQIAASSSL